MSKRNLVDDQVLDRKLHSNESLKIADAVKGLPDEELSLVWRSELNAKLLAVANRGRGRWVRPLRWTTGVGASIAASVALFVALMHVEAPQAGLSAKRDLESQMVAAHKLSVRSVDVAGEGLSFLDEVELASAHQDAEWTQEDLEPL